MRSGRRRRSPCRRSRRPSAWPGRAMSSSPPGPKVSSSRSTGCSRWASATAAAHRASARAWVTCARSMISASSPARRSGIVATATAPAFSTPKPKGDQLRAVQPVQKDAVPRNDGHVLRQNACDAVRTLEQLVIGPCAVARVDTRPVADASSLLVHQHACSVEARADSGAQAGRGGAPARGRAGGRPLPCGSRRHEPSSARPRD